MCYTVPFSPEVSICSCSNHAMGVENVRLPPVLGQSEYNLEQFSPDHHRTRDPRIDRVIFKFAAIYYAGSNWADLILQN